MKFDENEMKLNLNERLREVRENQKAKYYKGMIHELLFFTWISRVEKIFVKILSK